MGMLRPFSPNILCVALLRFYNFGSNGIKSNSFPLGNEKFKQVLGQVSQQMTQNLEKFTKFRAVMLPTSIPLSTHETLPFW
jgi:hypothetical protein